MIFYKIMDTNDLSLEAYGIIIKSDKISGFLKTDLGSLASKCIDEQEYLSSARQLVHGIIEDQETYLDDWLLTDRFDEGDLNELLEYIRSVQVIPSDRKIYLA